MNLPRPSSASVASVSSVQWQAQFSNHRADGILFFGFVGGFFISLLPGRRCSRSRSARDGSTTSCAARGYVLAPVPEAARAATTDVVGEGICCWIEILWKETSGIACPWRWLLHSRPRMMSLQPLLARAVMAHVPSICQPYCIPRYFSAVITPELALLSSGIPGILEE